MGQARTYTEEFKAQAIKLAKEVGSKRAAEELDALEQLYVKYSVHMLCEALKVPRGTFYNFILRNKRNNTWYSKRQEELRIKIQKIYDESNQIFGAAKIAAVLKEQGYQTSDKTVRKLMRDMGLISIRQDAKSIYDKEQRKFKNRLNQQFNVSMPNEVWVSDVTYFRWNEKNIYICAIIDLYARMIVGYKIGLKNSTQLIKSTFKAAYELRHPTDGLIFHTDRGSNYRSKSFSDYLKATSHNDRLTALRATCLHIFRHITQILLEIRQYSCVEFMQSDRKSDCAIHTQSLCGVALNR